MGRMKEREFISSKLIPELKKRDPVYVYKIPDGTPCPKCGTFAVGERRPFDLVVVARQVAIACEVKMEKTKPSEHQEAHLRLWANAGGVGMVSTRGEQLLKFIDSIPGVTKRSRQDSRIVIPDIDVSKLKL